MRVEHALEYTAEHAKKSIDIISTYMLKIRMINFSEIFAHFVNFPHQKY